MKISNLFCGLIILSCLTYQVRVDAQTISWTKVNGPYSGSIQLLTVNPSGDIFAATSAGMYQSTDKGGSWQSSGLNLEFGASYLVADSVNNVYTGNGSEGFYESTDNGVSWAMVGVVGNVYSATVISGNRICVGGRQTVSISNDHGKTWSVSQVTTDPVEVLSVAEDNSGNIYAGLQAFAPRDAPAYGGGVYVSSDSGKTWNLHELFLTSILSIAVDDNGKIFSMSADAKGNKYLLADKSTYTLANPLTLFRDRRGEIVALTDIGLFAYKDSTDTWKNIVPPVATASMSTAFYDPDGITYAGTERDGVYFLEKSSSSWLQCGVYPDSLQSLGMDGSGKLYAGNEDGIYRQGTADGMWQRITEGLSRETVFQIHHSKFLQRLFAATSGGLFYLADGGNQWIPLIKQFAYDIVESSVGDGYVGSTGGILTAHAGDDFWSVFPAIGLPNTKIYCLAVDSSDNLFAGTKNAGIFKSTNEGKYWDQTDISSPFIFYSVNAINIDTSGRMFAGTDSAGAFYSDDAGTVWKSISTIDGKDVTCFLVNGVPEYCAGTSDHGIFLSADHGLNWQSANNGLTNSSITSLIADQLGYLYAATKSGLFKSTDVTAVSHPTNEPPSSFSLSQNFPNPFNPTTHFRLAIGDLRFVSLKVYDVLGREVATMMNERKLPGTYDVQFDGSKCSSGTYFYRLVSGDYTETKKMVLMK